jgi:glutathione S-transferase
MQQKSPAYAAINPAEAPALVLDDGTIGIIAICRYFRHSTDPPFGRGALDIARTEMEPAAGAAFLLPVARFATRTPR